MDSIGISEFKAKCIAILKEVHAGNSPLTVTYRGEPLVRIEPIKQPNRVLGALRNKGRILEDLVALDFDEEWEFETSP